jgi:hypothetical protein
VRRDHDHAPLLPRARDRLSQPARSCLIQIREWLVQQKKWDAFRFHTRESCPPALTGGQALDGAIHVLAHAPAAKGAIDPVGVATTEAHEELEVLAGGETAQKHRAVADIKDIAHEAAIAASEGYEAGQCAKERRLARAVGPAHEGEAGAHRDVRRAEDHAIVEDDRGIVERCA